MCRVGVDDDDDVEAVVIGGVEDEEVEEEAVFAPGVMRMLERAVSFDGDDLVFLTTTSVVASSVPLRRLVVRGQLRHLPRTSNVIHSF